jgi:PD-(D/E)XK nuclease superfamily
MANQGNANGMKSTSTVSSLRGSPRPRLTRSQLKQFFDGINSLMGAGQMGSDDSSVRPQLARQIEKFFATINHRVELSEKQQRRIDKQLATGFNVFHLIEPDENKLSDILADLLDPKGSHGQGDLFLRLLFKQVGLGSGAKLSNNAIVQREAPTHGILKYRRRMDVFVDARALLVIENKLDSLEQRDQVKDYLEHLHVCTRGRRSRLIYLTPDGRPPGSLPPSVIEQERKISRLHCWSYQGQLRHWLENCRRDCKAQKIRNFLSDFMAYIESVLKRELVDNNWEDTDEN